MHLSQLFFDPKIEEVAMEELGCARCSDLPNLQQVMRFVQEVSELLEGLGREAPRCLVLVPYPPHDPPLE